MFEFLKTHPSLFIIGATVIIIILIFLFFTKKQSHEYKIEQMECQTDDIELQLYPDTSRILPDEVDSSVPITPPLPGPKLSRKLRYDTSNQPRKAAHIYDTPRMQPFAAIPESVADESSSSFSYVPAEIQKQADITEAAAGTSTSANQVVVFRESNSTNQENRVSVSDVHRLGSYVSFDGEFDSYDEFRKSCVDTMRITVDFGANNSNYIVPVQEEI